MRTVTATAVTLCLSVAVLFAGGCKFLGIGGSENEGLGSVIVEGDVVPSPQGPKFYTREFLHAPGGQSYFDLFTGEVPKSEQIDLTKYEGLRLRISTVGPTTRNGLANVKVLKSFDRTAK